MIELDRSVDLGDLLTSFTIIVSLFGLLYSIDQNTQVQEEEALRKRAASAAQVIVALDQWSGTETYFVERLQPVFVEASRIAVEAGVEEARDFYWGKVTEIRAEINGQIVDQGLRSSYQNVMIFYPDSRNMYLSATRKISKREDDFHRLILTEGQNIILGGDSDSKSAVSIGNDLREMAVDALNDFRIFVSKDILNERRYFCSKIFTNSATIDGCTVMRNDYVR